MRAAQERELEPYVESLRAYLREGAPEQRAAAFQLGRAALSRGVGLLELLAVHQQFLGEHPVRSLDFLAEVLGPFEMALRGYRDANFALRELSNSLQEQVAQRTRQLQDAERRYREVVEGLPAVTYVTDLQGKPEYVSPQLQTLLGFSPEEWLAQGPGWLERVHLADRDLVEEQLRHATPGRRSTQEYRLKGRDGQFRWVRDDRVVLEDRRQQGLWMDITELRRLEEQLRHSQKMDAVGQLASGVAHDFNNVLTAILSFGGFVRDDLPPEHPSRADIEEVLRAGERGAGLTRQLLALSRRTVFSPTLLDLNDVVREMERLLQRLIGEQLGLKAELEPAPWPILGDRGQLEQVLLNLVVNARDAMPEGGTVRLRTANVRLTESTGRLGGPPGDFAMLEVTDTGIGMTPEVLDRIFEPFFTTKLQGKGTGLGLAVVSGILKQAGGELAVESEPGKGSTFRVYLPRASEPVAPAEGEPLRAAVPRSGTETILLVEDDPEVRSAARRILADRGYRVMEAESGAAALALAEDPKVTVDLLLTDVMLPELPGPALAERLRAQRPGLRVAFMSGHTGESTFHEAVLHSGAQFVPKPFSPQTLADCVREALDAPSRG